MAIASFRLPTLFVDLPRELRQKILLEAVSTEVQKAIDSGYVFSAFLVPGWELNAKAMPAKLSLAAASNMISMSPLVHPDVLVDIKWVNEKCWQLLSDYGRRFPMMIDMEDGFMKLSEWVIKQRQGEMRIRNYRRKRYNWFAGSDFC